MLEDAALQKKCEMIAKALLRVMREPECGECVRDLPDIIREIIEASK